MDRLGRPLGKKLEGNVERGLRYLIGASLQFQIGKKGTDSHEKCAQGKDPAKLIRKIPIGGRKQGL